MPLLGLFWLGAWMAWDLNHVGGPNLQFKNTFLQEITDDTLPWQGVGSHVVETWFRFSDFFVLYCKS